MELLCPLTSVFFLSNAVFARPPISLLQAGTLVPVFHHRRCRRERSGACVPVPARPRRSAKAPLRSYPNAKRTPMPTKEPEMERRSPPLILLLRAVSWSKGPVSDTASEPFRPSPALPPFLPALSWGSTAMADFQFFQRVSPGPLLPTPAQPAA